MFLSPNLTAAPLFAALLSFFLMIPLPPRSTLFPYTTLFRSLDRADRDSIGPAWDPKATPWLKAEQVRAVYLAMPEMERAAPWRAMFAVGTFAGLRTGEVIAL